MGVGLDLINELLRKLRGGEQRGGWLLIGVLKPFKKLNINNILFLNILNYSLQLNKNYFLLFNPLSSVIKSLMDLDSLTSSSFFTCNTFLVLQLKVPLISIFVPVKL